MLTREYLSMYSWLQLNLRGRFARSGGCVLKALDSLLPALHLEYYNYMYKEDILTV